MSQNRTVRSDLVPNNALTFWDTQQALRDGYVIRQKRKWGGKQGEKLSRRLDPLLKGLEHRGRKASYLEDGGKWAKNPKLDQKNDRLR